MPNRASRTIIYSYVKSAIDDAQDHMRSAYDHAFNRGDIDLAIEKCYQAMESDRQARQHIFASRKIISARQMSKYEDELAAVHKCFWCLVKEISNQSKSCYIRYGKSRALRLHFLAYSHDPQEDARPPEDDLAIQF